MFKNLFLIYEQNLNGDYKNVEPYEYVMETKTNITGEEINEIIFQACEIERIPDGMIMVDLTMEKDGEWYSHDEGEFEISIVRTDELSDYIDWEKCPKAPPIYKVDKEKSKLNIII